MLSSHPQLGVKSGISLSGFPTKHCVRNFLSHNHHMLRPYYTPSLYHPNNILRGIQIVRIMQFSLSNTTSPPPFRCKHILQITVLEHPWSVSHLMWYSIVTFLKQGRALYGRQRHRSLWVTMSSALPQVQVNKCHVFLCTTLPTCIAKLQFTSYKEGTRFDVVSGFPPRCTLCATKIQSF
jgi:hypothetical protein